MRDDLKIPELTFPSIQLGILETPIDLKILLYKGGSSSHHKKTKKLIEDGTLGEVIPERVELISRIHEFMSGELASGGSRHTIWNQFSSLRAFFGWQDLTKISTSIDNIDQAFLAWAEALLHRHRVEKDITMRSAYSRAACIGIILDSILERPTKIISTTRLIAPNPRKSAISRSAEKELLEGTFAFGHALQDICDGLPSDVVLKAPLPLRITLRTGQHVEQWSGARLGTVTTPGPPHTMAFLAFQNEGTLRTRSPLANLRIEAELLIFIAQTGMNLSQAHQLKLRHFFYASYLDGYQVRDRKNRRGGEVLFEIFKDYRPHFERYLAWRRELFPDSDLLFPFVRRGRIESQHPQFRLRAICRSLGIRFVPPQTLRSTRVNWLLRRSGDADQTAEMAQHTKQTLLHVYERPSQQRAMAEVTHFWSKHDPQLLCTTAVAPGACDGTPAPEPSPPRAAPSPDCIRPSGCLWCEKHRDIDSQDYVWALASFRHIKVIELASWHAPKDSQEVHPARLAIDRLSDKLAWFRESNARRRGWVDEALARIDEGDYHHDWRNLISTLEGRP